MPDRNESRSRGEMLVLKSQRAFARADSKMAHASPHASQKHTLQPLTLLRSEVDDLKQPSRDKALLQLNLYQVVRLSGCYLGYMGVTICLPGGFCPKYSREPSKLFRESTSPEHALMWCCSPASAEPDRAPVSQSPLAETPRILGFVHMHWPAGVCIHSP